MTPRDAEFNDEIVQSAAVAARPEPRIPTKILAQFEMAMARFAKPESLELKRHLFENPVSGRSTRSAIENKHFQGQIAMAVETAETLKRELTDKYVVVADDVPELRRFRGLTGIVKTVNMSGRALVQFDGPADIGWYDIDPTYLNIVDAPLPKVKPAEAHEAPATKPAPEKAAPKKAAGMSPLELARQQGAAGGGAKAQAAPAAGGGKKLSPLELARQQGAAKAGGAKPAGEKPTPATGSSNGEKKLSPLELARQQGAAKPADAAGSETQEPPKPAGGAKLSPLELARQQGAAKRSEGDAGKPELESESVATAVEAPPAPEPPKPAATEDMSGLSKLELARRQGPAKR